jgi:hypothetical protein
MIDWTISLGAIVNALVVTIGGVGMLFTMRAQLAMLNERLTALENEANTQTQILVDVAKQEARQDGLESRFIAPLQAACMAPETEAPAILQKPVERRSLASPLVRVAP